MLDFSLIAKPLSYLEVALQKLMNETRTDGCSVTGALPPSGFIKDIMCPLNRLPADPDFSTTQVYFLYCAGFVKIGMSKQPAKRMNTIQIVMPLRAQTVFLVRGGRRTEEYFHYAFKEYHVGGEWFEFGARIRDLIERKAPDYCLDWLKEEEDAHKDWIEYEAKRLGLIPPSQGEAA